MSEQHTIDVGRAKQWLEAKNFKRLRSILKKADVADAAELLNHLNIPECIVMLRLVARSERATLFSYLDFERQEALLEQLPNVVVIGLLNQMEPVDRTKLLEDLPPEITDKIISKMAPGEQQMAWKLLSYPDDSVGRQMSPEFVPLRLGMTAREALAYIRWNGAKYPDSMLHNLFVVDDAGILQGHVALSVLVTADPQTSTLRELMDPSTQSVDVFADQSVAVDFFRKYDRAVVPVVDSRGKMLGVLEADDVFDIAEEEATEDIHQFGGQANLEDSYFQTSFFILVRKRAGWLAVLFLGMTFSVSALKFYDSALASMRNVVYFLPMIISSGGNSGSQAAAMMIRGLAVREMKLRDWKKILFREIFTGISLGIILGSLGYGLATLMGQGGIIGLIIAVSLVGVVMFGAVVGSMLPFILKSLKLDPAVSSSPVIASLVDLIGIVWLFNVASYLTARFG